MCLRFGCGVDHSNAWMQHAFAAFCVMMNQSAVVLRACGHFAGLPAMMVRWSQSTKLIALPFADCVTAAYFAYRACWQMLKR